ncbi:hypothetical protein ACOMHN_002316 [Nucella lapillus]
MMGTSTLQTIEDATGTGCKTGAQVTRSTTLGTTGIRLKVITDSGMMTSQHQMTLAISQQATKAIRGKMHRGSTVHHSSIVQESLNIHQRRKRTLEIVQTPGTGKVGGMTVQESGKACSTGNYTETLLCQSFQAHDLTVR